MAKITGYKCDGPRCTETAEGAHIPTGWMTLSVRAQVPGRPPSESTEREDFHLCTNKCLKQLAHERQEAAVELGDEREMTNYMRRKFSEQCS